MCRGPLVFPGSSGCDSAFEVRDGDTVGHRLRVSAQAFLGVWTANRALGAWFLPLFLVFGYRSVWYPGTQTGLVARRSYGVARLLSLHRCSWYKT